MQGNPLGTLFGLCPKDEILFRTSIRPHFTSPCRISGQEPQLSPRGHPCPYPTPSNGQSPVGAASISVTPRSSFSIPGCQWH